MLKTHMMKLGATLFGVVLFYGLISFTSATLFNTRPATSVPIDENGRAIAMDPNVVLAEAAPAASAAPAPAAAPEEVEEVVELDPFTEIDPATIVGDATAGEAVFQKNCKTCHKVDGKNAVGPHLDGVVGRATGTVEGFKYSKAMKGHTGYWTADRLTAYLTEPKAEVPKNKMAFAGFKDDTQSIQDVIAYLYSVSQ
ncbi:cytochrome c [Rhodobacter aestuarii]|uniref:Cytochrome c n=1 Tax=Rhodobacter aestuarii TaxID=453582 RepID=A0A1N7KTS6_9RHOB|nr:cytochrome c family protein [Rhodobacter aestuarii]PTV95577.1 cytochrome c [Rhodobacter aestuarii]SIS64951.1 cytochrome c [Rhodobacter aestuarii]